MRIAEYVQDSIVDGPGLRFTLFTQGCPHRCEGCHNPHTHDPGGGRECAVGDIIERMRSNPLLDGITFSGGEPFEQPGDCAKIARAAKENGLNVWCYTGFTLEELLERPEPEIREFLGEIDVLVDGRFEASRRSLSLKWRGSENQRIIDLKQSLAGEGPLVYYQL